jgi:aminoglycoside 3-N-acetyltransferase
MGAITEYFRHLPGVKRSLHPTEPVAALGPDATYFTCDHFGQLTPYNESSPFYKLTLKEGKILLVGVTLANSCINLHVLEDVVNFIYPVYKNKLFDVEIIDENSQKRIMKTKVHDKQWSMKRKCDVLIPLFEQEGVMRRVKIGNADSFIIDARLFLNSLKTLMNKGITIYSPGGESVS